MGGLTDLCSKYWQSWTAVFRIHLNLMWIRIRIRGSTSRNSGPGSGSDQNQKNSNIYFLFFSVKPTQTTFFFVQLWTYYSCVSNKKLISFKKNYILIISVDFYASISQFFLLPGSGSTFPKVDPEHVGLYRYCLLNCNSLIFCYRWSNVQRI